MLFSDNEDLLNDEDDPFAKSDTRMCFKAPVIVRLKEDAPEVTILENEQLLVDEDDNLLIENFSD